MLIAALIVFCVLLFILAFLAPRLSRYFQQAGDKPLQLGQQTTGKAPGRLGKVAPEAVLQEPQGGPEERGQGPAGAGEDASLRLNAPAGPE